MLLAGMVCSVALHAQTTLPRPVYSLTFEGATTVADVNAAINLRQEGIRILQETGAKMRTA